MNLVQKTLAAIQTVDPANVEHAIMIAESFLVKYAGRRLGEPLYPEVLQEEVSEKDIHQLKTALVKLVEAHPLKDYATIAVFVLGKWEDRSVIPTLVEFMKLNFVKLTPGSQSMHAVWNAMNSLDSLGEDIFPWENGFKSGASNEFERNRQLAARYLEKKGLKCQ
ncbi:MAG TPA: hypothetical protein VFE62_02190 [Gemmataceae bacterium]|nr:hypothetical protein [Gemmataceae bacterium]